MLKCRILIARIVKWLLFDFGLMPYLLVKFGHVGMVSSPYHAILLNRLEKAANIVATDSLNRGRRRTV